MARPAGAAGGGAGAAVQTPVTLDDAVLREAARAAGLAAHSAAGLCAARRSVVAARLLRTAEALARSAVAALAGAARPASLAAPRDGTASATPPPTSASRRRRRRRLRSSALSGAGNVKAGDVDMGMTKVLGGSGAAAASHAAVVPVAAAAPLAGGAAASLRPPDASARRAPCPAPSSTPTAFTSAGAGSPEVFDVGSQVVLSGLASRPELEGEVVSVLLFESARDRYAVSLGTGEKILVRRECVLSLNDFIAKAGKEVRTQ